MPSATNQAGYLNSLSTQDNAHQDALFSQNNKGLDWITGPNGDPSKSPLYKSFLTQARTNIGNSYDSAIINARANAGARGFGYASPNEQVGETGIRGQEASELGRAPSMALDKTMPYNMEAMGLRANEAGVFGQEKMGEESMSNSDFMTSWMQREQNKRSLYAALAQLAGTAMTAGMAHMGGGGGGGGFDDSSQPWQM